MASLEAYRQQLVSPMSCEELQRDLQGSLETEDLEELQEEEEEVEEEEKRRGRKEAVSTGAISELTLLQLSLDGGERPVAELHQEALSMRPVAELHQRDSSEHAALTTGLVRQRLEQLSSLPLEDTTQPPRAPQTELMDLGKAGEQTAPPGPVEDMETDAGSAIGSAQALETPVLSPAGPSLLPSSPLGCSLTRSSSSDSLASLASVRGGQPGMVRQRAQEIEMRMRLAGLTIPSPLKRSNSLAKLGDLTLSTQDLSPSSQLSDSSGGEQTPRYPALRSILAKSQSGVPRS